MATRKEKDASAVAAWKDSLYRMMRELARHIPYFWQTIIKYAYRQLQGEDLRILERSLERQNVRHEKHREDLVHMSEAEKDTVLLRILYHRASDDMVFIAEVRKVMNSCIPA